jgi:hypothetical protein
MIEAYARRGGRSPLCQLCHSSDLAFVARSYASLVSAKQQHGRGVHWTHPDPFSQFIRANFEALWDTDNPFYLLKASKWEII